MLGGCSGKTLEVLHEVTQNIGLHHTITCARDEQVDAHWTVLRSRM